MLARGFPFRRRSVKKFANPPLLYACFSRRGTERQIREVLMHIEVISGFVSTWVDSFWKRETNRTGLVFVGEHSAPGCVVASYLQRYRLLPPLTVLEILQQSPAVTLDAVKVCVPSFGCRCHGRVMEAQNFSRSSVFKKSLVYRWQLFMAALFFSGLLPASE